MNEYICFLKPNRVEMVTDAPTPEESELLQAHYKYLTELNDREILRLAGRTQNTGSETVGIFIFMAEDLESAKELVSQDPVIKNKVMSAIVSEFKTAIG